MSASVTQEKTEQKGAISCLKKCLPLVSVVFSFAIYLRTLAPTIYWGDGIELSAVCASGGISHPTGYPLFTMFGYVISRFFPGNPALGTNLLCAFFASLASGAFYFAVRAALSFVPDRFFLHSHYRDIFAFMASLVLAFSSTLWFHATITEVYTLHILFVVLLLWSFLEYHRKNSNNWFLVFFGLWGLSFSHHMQSGTLAPLAFVMLWTFFHKKGSRKFLFLALVLFLLGFLPYIYLPLRAASKPSLNWGDPSNIRNFLWVVSGGDFKKHQFLMEMPNIPFTFSTFYIHALRRIRRFSFWLPGEIYHFPRGSHLFQKLGFALFMACVFWGSVSVFLREKKAVLGIWGSILMGMLMVLLYNIQDIEPYFLNTFPGFLILGIWGFAGISDLIERGLFTRKINFLPYIFILIPVFSLFSHYPIQDKSQNTDAYHYGGRILQHCPKRAIVLTMSDNDIYILWYFQKALGIRPDITVLGANFIHSGWYAEYFKNLSGNQPEFTIQQAASLPTREDFYIDLMLWIINPNIDRFPILLTFTDPFLEQMYQVRKVCQLLGEEDYKSALLSYLPPPYLFRLYKKEAIDTKQRN